MSIVPIGVSVLRHIEPWKPSIGGIQHIDFDLVRDDSLLVFKVLVGNFEAPHAIRLGPERGFKLMSGEDFKVISEIESGRAIKDAAVLLNELDEFHFAQVLRPLKHQVFEEVSKASTILWLDSEPDVVVDGDGHSGR